jgi:hypothetical protein
MISVVLSVIAADTVDNVLTVKPFAVNLIPASKYGEVQLTDVEFISNINVDDWLKTEPAYMGYDPFTGGWSLYGNLPGYLDGERKGFLDEFGIVTGQFFLATETGDDQILMMDMKMPSDDLKAKYEKHRNRLLFSPFQCLEARRVWGAETPIELFLIQALARERLYPQSQMLIMDDGATYPAWYHAWSDPKFRKTTGLVTEADLYFPAEHIAVFCDGSSHARKKNRERDAAIDAKLEARGIEVIRIPGSEIKFELLKAVSRVVEVLSKHNKPT